MTVPPKLSPPPKPASLQMALLLSALGWPGAGQALQKRWLAAAVYALGFTAAFLWLMLLFFRFMVQYYGLAFGAEPADDGIRPAGPWLPFALAFLLSFGLYLANLADVALAHWRRARKAHEDRLAPP